MSSNPENSGVNANNNTGTGNADAITGAQQNMVLQPRQLQEMAAKFRTLLTEARNVGETTPRGKELMFQAAKIKQVYDALTLNRRRQQAAQAYNNTSNPNSSNPASIPTENVPNSSQQQQQQQQQQQTRNNSNKFSNMIKQVLTPEENQEYEKLWQNFQVRHTSIKEKETYLKQNIDRLEQEINKQTDEGPKQQLQEKKIELLNDWKVLKIEYTKLFNNYQNSKKTFYVDSSSSNSNSSNTATATAQQQQRQGQNQRKISSSNSTEIPSVTGPDALKSQQQQQNTIPATNNPRGNVNTSQTEQSKAKVTNVNATASMLNNISSSKSAIFKQTEPAIPISENISTKTPAPVAYRSNRPTITGGSAMNASALNTPATTKLPPYEMDTQRVMSKRKLRELVKTVGIDEGDGETVIDGDVEELLLDLADDFVTNVTAFSCRLAKHRKSDNLEARDIQLHLERNWNIRIPGYSADEIRSTRKWNPSQNYNQKLQSITSDKVAAAKNNGNNVASLNTKK
ncbi:CIC_collapsed_G0010170.mRNA.1.CDS.1 [Saccharomyces cerevisiae]|nr:CIC_collapsed_G0010170.mRNA.1.CDS.1 [Saccharomyces cerevisiae]